MRSKEGKTISDAKVLMFTGIVIIVFLVAIFGFIFWEPVPEMIQGEAEATEVRISGKVPGRIEKFLVNEGRYGRDSG